MLILSSYNILSVNNEFKDCYNTVLIQGPSYDNPIDYLAVTIPISIITIEGESYEKLFEDMLFAIDSGVQCWIMQANTSTSFFTTFEELLHKHTLQRPFRSKVLIYGLNQEEMGSQILDIFNQTLFAGK